jgi:2-polyprenyl-3-methyl-5-hydroxy-6-metoxy-1,4-benzoquinol methylase
MTDSKDQSIRTRPVPKCSLCGTPGKLLYEGFRDRVFGAPGTWNLKQCGKNDCRLVWLDPVPIEEDIGLAYQNYYTHNQPAPLAGLVNRACWAVWRSYLRHRFGYTQGTGNQWTALLWPLALLHPGGRAELDSAAMYLPAAKSSARALDVGCGSGVLLERMKSLGWEVEGVEIDRPAVEGARARGVNVRLGTLHAQQYPGNHFDAVHMAHVIEHVHNPAEMLSECFRILTPGGKLVVITPNVESRGHRQFGAAWSNLDPPRHLVLFSRRTLQTMAEQAGFVIERASTTARSAWVYGAMSGQIKQTGKIDMRTFHNARWLSYGLTYQLRQRLALGSNSEAGDEVLLIATKR